MSLKINGQKHYTPIIFRQVFAWLRSSGLLVFLKRDQKNAIKFKEDQLGGKSFQRSAHVISNDIIKRILADQK